MVALAGGSIGAIIATLLRIRHERKEAMRQRMMEAADDLSTGIVQATIALDPVNSRVIPWHMLEAERRSEVRDEARRCLAEATARMGRIELLFGEGAVTAGGYGALKHLSQHWPGIRS